MNAEPGAALLQVFAGNHKGGGFPGVHGLGGPKEKLVTVGRNNQGVLL
jgi:hypothetical protein